MTELAAVPYPEDLDAEEQLLGAILHDLSQTAWDAIEQTGITARAFARESHSHIYQAALDLSTDGKPTDVTAVAGLLERRHQLKKAGGRARLNELAALNVATANAPHHADIVVEHARRTNAARLGHEIARLANDPARTSTEILEHAQQLLDATAFTEASQRTHLKVVPLNEFTAVTEDQADPAIGTKGAMLLPADGTLFMYGDGGAGKTTLSIDAAVHLAAGEPWLEQHIEHPLNVLVIENEGPRAPFRDVLARKRATWTGRPFADRIHVLEEPWTRFTLDQAAYRRQLAAAIDQTETDIVIVGPLASIGAAGTGTPDDVNAFNELVADLRSRTTRPFALWIIHHENKQGDVSGAWERYPDTLVHVSAQGNGRTRVHWLKVRWSSALHNTSTILRWTDNAGFEVEEKKERDYHAEILDAFRSDDRWRTAREISGLISANRDKLIAVLNDLVEKGEMRFEIGPAGRKTTAHCWRLSTGSDTPSHIEPQGQLIRVESDVARLARRIYEPGESHTTTHHHPTGSAEPEPHPEDAGPPDDQPDPWDAA